MVLESDEVDAMKKGAPALLMLRECNVQSVQCKQTLMHQADDLAQQAGRLYRKQSQILEARGIAAR